MKKYFFKGIIVAAAVVAVFLLSGADFTGASNPAPYINPLTANPTGLVPSTAVAGGPAFTLTVNGGGFISGSEVRWNGFPRTTTFISAIQLTATITAGDIASPGKNDVTVFNYAPGGGLSNSETFTVVSPRPTINDLTATPAGLVPSSAKAGSTSFTLTVNGTGYIAASRIMWNGAAKTTNFVNATQLTTTIVASDVATPGTVQVTVNNPAPGGGDSDPQIFTIESNTNPVPAITSLNPSSVVAGSGAFTLTVNGTGFISGSKVQFNVAPYSGWSSANDRTTTYFSSTQITAAITAADVGTSLTARVRVVNPGPGGGTSNEQAFNITVNSSTSLSITNLTPASAVSGSPAFTLTVDGTAFISGTSVVRWNGFSRTTTFVSTTRLTAAILSTDILTPGTASVTVANGATISNTATFTITAASNPVPSISSLIPSSATVGDPALTLTVIGTGFVGSSVVRWNGSDRTTTFVTATKVTAAIPASDLSSTACPSPPCTIPVRVFNPTPGGGLSGPLNFTINATNPVPTISSLGATPPGLNPSQATVGDIAFTMTVNGTGYVRFSVVNWNGAARTTTFVSATRLTISVPASDLTSPGTANVTVTNPTPGGGTSNTVVFTINSENPVPTINALTATPAGLSPSSMPVGSSSFTLTVNGSNFILASKIQWNGATRSSGFNFVNSTKLTVTIPSSDLTTPGTFDVTVYNQGPGGGTSNAVKFTVGSNNNPVPILTSISPTEAAVLGPAFTLTLNGSNFISSSVTRWNGSDRTTTFVSSTQLTAAIPASDLLSLGKFDVTVFNPAPGGGTSTSITFTVGNPAPITTSISPTIKNVGDPGFFMVVNGSNFISSSVVNFDGSARTTVFVSSSILTATIPASDLLTAGVFLITVTNPTPGGGTSNPQVFTVTSGPNPPNLTNLSVSEVSCPSVSGAGQTYFSWMYNDADGDNEDQFAFQMDDNSDFSSPVIDRTFSGLSNPPGTVNQQLVSSYLASTIDSIVYNTTYYWRARARDATGLYSNWTSGGSYQKTGHPQPFPGFTFSPGNPAPLTTVSFTNSSVCYNGTGTTACQSYSWDFGDGSPASILQNPTHAYSATGTFAVTLKTYDETGFCSKSQNINVTAGNSTKIKEVSPF